MIEFIIGCCIGAVIGFTIGTVMESRLYKDILADSDEEISYLRRENTGLLRRLRQWEGDRL